MPYTNIMLDLEIMGNGPTAAIVAIGAVAIDFDALQTGPRFYHRVTLKSALETGGTIDADTVLWWMRQSDDARREITRDGAIHINESLYAFEQYLCGLEPDKSQIKVWGNGAAFDNVILRGAYQRVSYDAPWDWRNDRCYRTLKSLHHAMPFERIGTQHNALDDALSQAKHLLKFVGEGLA